MLKSVLVVLLNLFNCFYKVGSAKTGVCDVVLLDLKAALGSLTLSQEVVLGPEFGDAETTVIQGEGPIVQEFEENLFYVLFDRRVVAVNVLTFEEENQKCDDSRVSLPISGVILPCRTLNSTQNFEGVISLAKREESCIEKEEELLLKLGKKSSELEARTKSLSGQRGDSETDTENINNEDDKNFANGDNDNEEKKLGKDQSSDENEAYGRTHADGYGGLNGKPYDHELMEGAKNIDDRITIYLQIALAAAAVNIASGRTGALAILRVYQGYLTKTSSVLSKIEGDFRELQVKETAHMKQCISHRTSLFKLILERSEEAVLKHDMVENAEKAKEHLKRKGESKHAMNQTENFGESITQSSETALTEHETNSEKGQKEVQSHESPSPSLEEPQQERMVTTETGTESEASAETETGMDETGAAELNRNTETSAETEGGANAESQYSNAGINTTPAPRFRDVATETDEGQ